MKQFFRIILILTFSGYSFTDIVTAQQQSIGKDVKGFGFLERICGQWNGPVASTTPAGNFDSWYVDFRPVSAGQVSQFSMLDSQTVNIFSFFIVKYNDTFKVAMRTEGCFAQKCCVTYEVIDSVNEEKGYYRFADFVSGKTRAYTEFTFSEGKFVMEVFTSKFNKENPPVLHTHFEAALFNRDATKESVAFFNFPQPVVIKDFTGVFKEMNESIYFDRTNDPYSSASQPYTGKVKVNITVDDKLKTKPGDEACVFLTTESLFKGIKYIPENLNSLSKYVYFPAGTKSVTINNVHPGKYYVYSFIDRNGDKKHLSGDYMSTATDNIIDVPADGKANATTVIDYIIR